MRIGVLGTGMVGDALATRLVGLGHDVVMGSRIPGNEKAAGWVARVGEGAAAGTFEAAAKHGELVVNATSGAHALDALRAAGAGNLAGKVLVDVTNPIVPGDPIPGLHPVSNDSLGEQVQREFPDARVVKTLNTVNCQVMVDPTRVPGDHAVFLAGEDAAAKATVRDLLGSFGWPQASIIDVGGIVAARGLEAYLLFWIGLRLALGTSDFNVSVVR